MRHDGADVQITTVPSTSFLQTDPEPGGSANAYDYCSQGPINCYDLDGQWGWSNVKKWWKKHGKTTLMVVGTVAAVVAIGTGAGALAGVGAQ